MKKNEKISLSNFFLYTKKGIFLSTPLGNTNTDFVLVNKLGGALAKLFKITPPFSLVVTHERVDLDAVMCAQLGEQYRLIPGNSTADKLKGLECGMVLDHPLGVKGKKSAFSEIYEEKGLLADILRAEVDAADTAREIPGHFSLDELCQGDEFLKSAYLSGVQAAKEERIKYLELEKDCIFHNCGEYIFVELPKKNESQTSDFAIWLQEKHSALVGAVYQDGFNLGIFRYPGKTAPSFEKIAKILSDWYFDHRGGWMLSWGTRKVQKTEKPPASSPQTTKELVFWVEKNQ